MVSRNIPQILRLGAGEDLARFFDAAVSMVEAWQKCEASYMSGNSADELREAAQHAQECLHAIHHGHPGPAETDAERRLKELRNASHEEGE